MAKEVYIKNKGLFFLDWQDFVYRLVTFSFYASFGTATLLLLLSFNRRLMSLGLLFLLFILERLVHFNKGDKTVWEIYQKGGNIAEALAPTTFRLLNTALNYARKSSVDFYLALLEELLSKREIVVILKRLDIPLEDFLNDARSFISIKRENELNYEAILEQILYASYLNALSNNDSFIYPRNVLAALPALKDEDIAKLFNKYGIQGEDLNAAVIFGKWKSALESWRLPSIVGGFSRLHFFESKRTVSRDWTSKPTPSLDMFSVDLTELARQNKLGFLIGHEKEFRMLLDVLSRPGKFNVLLVGEPGVGKSTIIEHLAYRIIKDEVPQNLFDKRLVSLKIGDLISGRSQEEIFKLLETIVKEILLASNVVLFIPDIHLLFKTSSNLTAIDFLLPAIKNYPLPIIGETSPLYFKKYIEENLDFLEQFEVIRVQEISEEEAVKFLIYRAVIMEKSTKVFIPFSVIKRAVYLAVRYFHQKPLPGSAVALLERAVGKVLKEKRRDIKVEDLDQVAEENSAIPIQKAGAEEIEKLLNLEKIIHEKFINQDIAVNAVARALREYRSGLTRKGSPIASFLFVGPTGVGKTELSKILAEIQFGSKEAMIRFDMSEFQDKLSIYKLLGQPDGSSGGLLTDAVYERPYSLILLDEFEKAHPDILNVFLQVLDDGRLTDSLGKTVSFENTIIIATSNANSDFIKESIEAGKKMEEIALEVKKRLTNFFRPELLNRFSDIVVFRDLNKNEIKQIAGLLMNELRKTLEEEKGIAITFDDTVLSALAERGYDPVFGARPLRKVISEEIKSILALEILKANIQRGDTIKIGFTDGQFFANKVAD